MNRLLAILFTFLILGCGTSCAGDEPDKAPANTGEEYFSGKKVLVAYFSWGGTTKHMAEQIRDITGADIFRIEPVTPYPMAYTPCTEVALEEKNSNTRPAIKDRVANWDDYDVVFIGCPVWWWTTPMIIHTFAESYDFTGKTVVPFCTYAATYRDETLAEIVNITPAARHLTGEGLTGGSISAGRIQSWIDLINEEWNESGGAGINDILSETVPPDGRDMIYDLSGRHIAGAVPDSGVYIVKSGQTATKILIK